MKKGLLLLCAAAAMPLAVRAQPSIQGASSITGIVFDPARRPVPDLWMELLDEVDSILARARTDGTGRYQFQRLSNGVFQVRAVTVGTKFAAQTQRVSLVPSWQTVGTRAVHEHVDFYLRPAEAAASNPTPGLLFAQDVPAAARGLFEQAVSLLDAKAAEEGVARLKEAVAAFPDYYLALERLGLELVRLGRYDEVLAPLGRAIEVNPKGQDSLYALGVARYRLGMYGEAADVLRRAIAAAPATSRGAFAQYFLGMSLARAGSAAEAEEHLQRAYQQGGANIPADVHMALAQIYSDTKRYGQAADELELFLKESPDARDAVKIRALVERLRAKSR